MFKSRNLQNRRSLLMLSYAPDRSMKAAPKILPFLARCISARCLITKTGSIHERSFLNPNIVSGMLVSVAAMSLLLTMQLQSLHVVVGIERGL